MAKGVMGTSKPVTPLPGVLYFPGDTMADDDDTDPFDTISTADRRHFSALESLVRSELRGMRRDHAILREQQKDNHDEIKGLIGHVSEDGMGGTGVLGSVARLTRRVDLLYGYRSIGVGIVMAVTALGGLVAWAINIIFAFKGKP